MGKIEELYVEINEYRHELSAINVDFNLDQPVCSILPVDGVSSLYGYSVPGLSYKLPIKVGQEAKVYMIWNGDIVPLFHGRVAEIRPAMIQGGVGNTTSAMTTTILLKHIFNDLASVSIGRVFFNDGAYDKTKPHKLKLNDTRESFQSELEFDTSALSVRREIAVHIKEIIVGLSDWYQYKGRKEEIQFEAGDLVKALNCTYREALWGENKTVGVKALNQMIRLATVEAVNSKTASGGTFLEILDVLASYTYFRRIPRLHDIVIVPDLAVYKPTVEGDGFSKKYLLEINRTEQMQGLIVDRVGVNIESLISWGAKSRNHYQPSVDFKEGTRYDSILYPPVKKGEVFTNALIIEPSPLLRGRLAIPLTANKDSKENEEKPKTMTKDGEGASKKAQSGEEVYSPSNEEAIKLAERASKAGYGMYAYGGSVVQISVVLEALLEANSNFKNSLWGDGSIYSTLGQIVKVDLLQRQDDFSYSVGRIISISLQIDINAGGISCRITLDNVRSGLTDQEHSLDIEDHPVYENIGSSKVV